MTSVMFANLSIARCVYVEKHINVNDPAGRFYFIYVLII